MQNIATKSFSFTETSTVEKQVIVSQNENALFQFTLPALLQILKAAGNYSVAGDALIPSDEMAFVSRIAVHAVQNSDNFISLERQEVVTLRTFIEARMAHCEKERDNRQPTFNPDTYISLKFMLLDIREWLMGDIIVETSLLH